MSKRSDRIKDCKPTCNKGSERKKTSCCYLIEQKRILVGGLGILEVNLAELSGAGRFGQDLRGLLDLVDDTLEGRMAGGRWLDDLQQGARPAHHLRQERFI